MSGTRHRHGTRIAAGRGVPRPKIAVLLSFGHAVSFRAVPTYNQCLRHSGRESKPEPLSSCQSHQAWYTTDTARMGSLGGWHIADWRHKDGSRCTQAPTFAKPIRQQCTDESELLVPHHRLPVLAWCRDSAASETMVATRCDGEEGAEQAKLCSVLRLTMREENQSGQKAASSKGYPRPLNDEGPVGSGLGLTAELVGKWSRSRSCTFRGGRRRRSWRRKRRRRR